ncbi:hypothetical protein RF11_11872 [Thelohanellus kitauei]|uniref:Uncharacterized protein n=1 Tax=Thelohanellus kitauei TaxID=669202 RepID=A0A0C2NL04_THEKT|nr:hypothetical protein RF11_11872 [Thelohanellus kitauei]
MKIKFSRCNTVDAKRIDSGIQLSQSFNEIYVDSFEIMANRVIATNSHSGFYNALPFRELTVSISLPHSNSDYVEPAAKLDVSSPNCPMCATIMTTWEVIESELSGYLVQCPKPYRVSTPPTVKLVVETICEHVTDGSFARASDEQMAKRVLVQMEKDFFTVKLRQLISLLRSIQMRLVFDFNNQLA